MSHDVYTFGKSTARDVYVNSVFPLSLAVKYTSCGENSNLVSPLVLAGSCRRVTHTPIQLSAKFSEKIYVLCPRLQSSVPAKYSGATRRRVTRRHVTYTTIQFPRYN